MSKIDEIDKGTATIVEENSKFWQWKIFRKLQGSCSSNDWLNKDTKVGGAIPLIS